MLLGHLQAEGGRIVKPNAEAGAGGYRVVDRIKSIRISANPGAL